MSIANDPLVEQDDLIGAIDHLASESLKLWDVPSDARSRLINVSENATYLVENVSGYKSILRVHREGYHSYNGIASELAWTSALKTDGQIHTPSAIAGRNGELIQKSTAEGLSKRYMVLFEYVDGTEPLESDDLVLPFERLGELAAITHEHSKRWLQPDFFERMSWNLETFFGSAPTWGNWRDAPNMTSSYKSVLSECEKVITKRLVGFGQSTNRYGLIHADMRLANLLIDNDTTHLIDFDDCGFGWNLYDFATGISFMEDHPQVPLLKTAWVKGYRKVMTLSDEDEHEIETFIMLRRIALCAWMGTHSDVDIVKQLSPSFVPVTSVLAEKYLEHYS